MVSISVGIRRYCLLILAVLLPGLLAFALTRTLYAHGADSGLCTYKVTDTNNSLFLGIFNTHDHCMWESGDKFCPPCGFMPVGELCPATATVHIDITGRNCVLQLSRDQVGCGACWSSRGDWNKS